MRGCICQASRDRQLEHAEGGRPRSSPNDPAARRSRATRAARRAPAQRGGRHRAVLRQPHWHVTASGSRRRASPSRRPRRSSGAGDPATVGAPADRPRGLRAPPPAGAASPACAVDGRELPRARRARSRTQRPLGDGRALPRPIDPDALDIELLELIWRFRHVLSSQLHRRFNPDRAITTTQRRLKRLSDAGLVERFQFHRRDGGGVPMCYVITPAGR